MAWPYSPTRIPWQLALSTRELPQEHDLSPAAAHAVNVSHVATKIGDNPTKMTGYGDSDRARDLNSRGALVEVLSWRSKQENTFVWSSTEAASHTTKEALWLRKLLAVCMNTQILIYMDNLLLGMLSARHHDVARLPTACMCGSASTLLYTPGAARAQAKTGVQQHLLPLTSRRGRATA
jgi:hypothetical protein